MESFEEVKQKAEKAKKASQILQSVSTEKKNKVLEKVKELLIERKDEILKANKKDLEKAEKDVKEGSLSNNLFKRLDLEGKNSEKYNSLLQGVSDVIDLDDPVGKVTLASKLEEGLELYRVSCAIGVICIIFEARPEVAIQISSLVLKSANAVILKGGQEAAHSNDILVRTFRDALGSVEGVPVDAVQLVSTRESIQHLLSMDNYLDLIIPRGSNQLVKHIQSNTRIPVLGHADGICSVYVDQFADRDKAIRICLDSKTNYVAACNSCETIIVHRSILSTFFKDIVQALIDAKVQVRMEPEAFQSFENVTGVTKADPQDFHTEFLDYIVAIKVVGSVSEAIDHVNTNGSHHTDCIVTENKEAAKLWMSTVDSAGVYHNASTRFADGFRYGFGAEIGVSTNKTHARGPVGLEGLVIYKYRIYGNGDIVSEFSEKKRNFLHQPLPFDEIKKYE